MVMGLPAAAVGGDGRCRGNQAEVRRRAELRRARKSSLPGELAPNTVRGPQRPDVADLAPLVQAENDERPPLSSQPPTSATDWPAPFFFRGRS